MPVVACDILHASIPLKKPYPLSFVTVERVDSVVVRLTLDDGRAGIGEVVPLPGYSPETVDSILASYEGWLPRARGSDIVELRDDLNETMAAAPFARSAILVALECAEGRIELPDRLEIPLVAPLAANMPEEALIRAAMAAHEAGYRTLKLKIGMGIGGDCRSVSLLLDELPAGVRLRLDANQAYSERDVGILFDTLEHPRAASVELLEQPFGIDDWARFAALTRAGAPVPLMLDESIVEEEDIERAADAGADLVKLKLYKQRGVQGLVELAQTARRLGLGVVLGNGVATEIGNLHEAAAFQTPGLFSGAFEGNGFEKLAYPALRQGPRVELGCMVWARPDPLKWDELLETARYRRVLCA